MIDLVNTKGGIVSSHNSNREITKSSWFYDVIGLAQTGEVSFRTRRA